MTTLFNYKGPSMRVLSTDNKGKFGVNRIEYQVSCKNGVFTCLRTDGFKFLDGMKITDSIDEVKAFLRQGK